MLGKGGMGEVYLAEDTRLQRQIALKLLPENVNHDPERLMRFYKEAETTAKLNHPNIATIHNVENAKDRLFIVMEYVEGETVRTPIPKHGIDLDLFCAWFLPISDAMAYAHEMGVTHRDLKPGNLMVKHEGTPKILDFGLARITGPEGLYRDSSQELTSPGGILVTPAYMLPEQVTGQQVGPLSDLFSLGVVMYDAITGRHPFLGDNTLATAHRIIHDDPPSAFDLKLIPPVVGDLLTTCLQKRPVDRYQSMRALHQVFDDLSGTLNGPELEVSPHSAINTSVIRPTRKLAVIMFTDIADFTELFPSLSPDGRYLAFQSNESGWWEVYVRHFPTGERKWQVSVAGGQMLRWQDQGSALFYVQDDRLMTVPVSTQGVFRFGSPQGLFSSETLRATRLSASYDVNTAGQQFVMVQNLNEDKAMTLTVVQNWYTEFTKTE